MSPPWPGTSLGAGHWGPFPTFALTCCVTLGGLCPSLGLSVPRTPKHSLLMEESSCLRFKIAPPTPTATMAKGLCPLKTFSQGPAVCQRSAKMSLVYTQTATSPRPILVPRVPRACPHVPDLLSLSPSSGFLATLKGCLALGFLLRLELEKCAGDICPFSNPTHSPACRSFIQRRFAK